MRSLFLLLSVLLGSTIALRCYQQQSEQKNYKPKEAETTVCDAATQCLRITGSDTIIDIYQGHKISVNGTYLDCDKYNICNQRQIRGNECVDYQGSKICCCSETLCNSSRKIASAVFVILPILKYVV